MLRVALFCSSRVKSSRVKWGQRQIGGESSFCPPVFCTSAPYFKLRTDTSHLNYDDDGGNNHDNGDDRNDNDDYDDVKSIEVKGKLDSMFKIKERRSMTWCSILSYIVSPLKHERIYQGFMFPANRYT